MSDEAHQQYEFDMAVSFAGEDRAYVNDIAEAVKSGGVKVFYDEDYEVEAWGQDGVEYFTNVYQNRARYAVMFVSQHYAEKVWTNLERRAVLARAATQRGAYVLPVRLDDTELPGLLPTVIYLDARRYGIEKLVEAIKTKVGGSALEKPTSVVLDGKVPRSPETIEALVSERPDGWEYMLYAALLNAGMEKLEPKYRDYVMGYAPRTGRHIAREDLNDVVQAGIGAALAITNNFNAVFQPDVQERAFGPAGEPGDPDRIAHMAERFVSVYEDFLDWAAELRGTSAAGSGAEVFQALALWVGQPIEECRRFVREFVSEADTFTERLAAAENIELTLRITLELDEEISDAVLTKMRQALTEGDQNSWLDASGHDNVASATDGRYSGR
jgi:hypothetical protein